MQLKPVSEPFAILGEFWHSQSPNKKFTGTLLYKPNDIVTLELIGDYTGQGVCGRLSRKESVIKGQLQDGRQCTILNYEAYVTTYKEKDGYHFKTDIKAIYLLIGIAFDSLASIRFSKVLVGLSHLKYWMELPLNIDFDNFFDFNNISISKNFINFTADIGVTPCKSICIYPTFRHPYTLSYNRGFFIDYEFVMEVALEKHVSYEELIDLHYKITNLFTLFCAEPVYHEILIGYCEDVPVQVYNAYYNRFNPLFDKSSIDIIAFPVRQSSFLNEERIITIFRNWFNFYGEFDNLIKLLVSCFIDQHKTVEDKFLSLVRCLEVYYDKRYPAKHRYFEPEECAEAIEKIKFPNEFKNEYKKRIKREIRRINTSINLHEKLLSSFSEIPSIELYPILDNPRDGEMAIKEFAAKVAHSRNYFTHYGSTPEHERFSVLELIRVNNKLKMIALYLLYRHLGLEASEFSVLCLRHK